MANKGALALAVAVGYVLGRHHKLRLATALVVAGVTRELRKGDGGLLKQGVKSLGTSPQLEEITSRLRTELMDVGKTAAIAATSRQIDSFSSKLHDRAESLRVPAPPPGAAPAGQADGEEPEEEPHEDEYEEEPPTDEAPPERPRARRERPQAAPVHRAGR
ncbi:hypothetical protein LDL08_07370 [Nonomuraea glycinis]|uniref:DNA primase n=1 Tax=Nonomuraea glycinis TaxID=2047744 RepID=A0A918E4G8_9ACTN|nr:hypothetical protein [Nonomuraea glycinis]MCA2175996.1 hypothetical protein [Nonomuraea glycinis]GGP05810.1 hypothetical protein GCM10012278_26840 [Nonomuraea glycinis]